MQYTKTKLIIESRYEKYISENTNDTNDTNDTKELKKYDKLDKKEYYRLFIINENNKLITEDVLNNVFKKYKLNHKVKNLINFQQVFITEAYLEVNILNNDFLRKIKDAECSKNPEKALPLIKHIPVIINETNRKVIQ